MGRRRNDAERVLGPYSEQGGRRWLVQIVGGGGGPEKIRCKTKREAERFIAEYRERLDEEARGLMTVRMALEQYEVHIREIKRLTPSTRESTLYRLNRLLGEPDRPLRALSPTVAAGLYEALTRARKPNGQPLSVAYLSGALQETKTWAAWCVGRGWLRENPFAEVKALGRKNRGKVQLTGDEAKKWTAKAIELAQDGEPGPVAALCALLLGLRAGEVTDRVVRDLDQGGSILIVTKGKTANAARRVEVPEPLRHMLLARAQGKDSSARLFPFGSRRVRAWTRAICKKAGVLEVCAQSMRGLHSTLSVAAGHTAHTVAAALGQAGPEVTRRHYIAPGTIEAQQQRAVLQVIAGGREAG